MSEQDPVNAGAVDVPQEPPKEPVLMSGFTPTNWTENKYHCLSELKQDVDDRFALSIAIMNKSWSEIDTFFADVPKINFENDVAGQEWYNTAQDARMTSVRQDRYVSRLNDPNSKWMDYVPHSGEELRPGRPQFKDEERLEGEQAILQLRQMLNLGGILQVPLWHSGFWVTVKTPSDADLMVLDTKLQMEKISLGMSTRGLVFSNSTVVMNHHVVDFVLDHVQNSTMKDFDKTKFMSMIKTPDLPILLWALASTIFPTGFPLTQPCTSGPEKCIYIKKALLTMARLLWVDITKITESMRKHMTDRMEKKTIEQIMEYQKSLPTVEKNYIDLTEDVRLILSVPSLDRYIASGFQWVRDIVELVDRFFSSKLSDAERDKEVGKHAMLSYMRQYSHWVEKIVFSNGKEIVERGTIEEAMKTMSGDMDLQDKYLDDIGTFIDDCSFAVIAIPRYSCPKCQTPISEEYKKHPLLTPLDTLRLFFILRTQRLLRAKVTA